MLGGSYPLFRIAGTLLQVHLTFPLLLAYVAFDGWQSGGEAGAIYSVVFVLLLFVCVILHEFGHVAAARRYGIRTPTVTLTPIGGIAALERMPEKPGQEIVVALAGPAVTLAVAAVLFAILWLLGATVDLDGLTQTQADALHLVNRLAIANVVLLVFNLIPAFPMDGGRVLRGVLSTWLGAGKATLIAARIGQAFALGFAGLAVLYDPMLLLVAIFIFLAAEAELRHSRRRGSAGGPTAGSVSFSNLRVLNAADTVESVAASFDELAQPAFPVANASKSIAGTVTRTKLAEAWMSGARGARIEALMTPGLPTVKAEAPLSAVYAAVMASDAALIGVVDDRNKLIGFLSKEHLLSMSPERQATRPTGPLVS